MSQPTNLEHWDLCVQAQKERLSDEEYNRWLSPLKVKVSDEGEIQLQAPNEHFINLLCGKELWSDICSFYQSSGGSKGAPLLVTLKEEGVTEGRKVHSEMDERKGLLDTQISRLKKSYAAVKSNRFTFDNFIEGKNNNLVLNVARFLVDGDQSGHYNPFFIYGNSGVGKTHLLLAIRHELKAKQTGRTAYYQQATDFVSSLVNALRNNRMEAFKKVYRSPDILLMDDVEFFTGKQSSMEEFFQLINYFIDNQKQIILTSDRMPNEIDMPDRIRSRLISGLALPIGYPDFEHRVLILIQKAKELGIALSEEVAYWISSKAEVSVRELHGLLKTLKVHIEHGFCREVNLAEVQRLLSPSLAVLGTVITPEKIMKNVTAYYALRPDDLISKNRRRPIVHARHIAMTLVKELTSLSLSEIGDLFVRDHSSVIHALNKIAKERRNNMLIDQDYRNITHKLMNPN